MEGKTLGLESLYSSFYRPHSSWPKLPESVLELPSRYNFDLELLNRSLSQIFEKNLLKPLQVSNDGERHLRSYRGFGFTSRPNAINPYQDAFSMFDEFGRFNSSSQYVQESDQIKNRSPELEFKDRHFTQRNEYFGPELEAVLAPFLSPFGKVRILELLPGGRIAPHVDFPYYDQIRVHACLKTNEDVWYEVEGKKFQIPANGSFYWFDSGLPHSVWNNGSSTRTVLSVHLSPYFDLEGKSLHQPEVSVIDLIKTGRI